MQRQLRDRGHVVLDKMSRAVAKSAPGKRGMRGELRSTRKQVARLRARVAVLEEEMQESRQLNRRLAEITDVVQELLVPIAQRDEEKLRERLDRFSASL